MLLTQTKNTVTYCVLQKKKLFMLIITSSKGWGIVLHQKFYFLIKEKKAFLYIPPKKVT